MVSLGTEIIIICTGRLEIQIKMEKNSLREFDFMEPILSGSVKDPLELK